MTELTIEKHLAGIFEDMLEKFFAASMSERLEESKKHFSNLEVGKRINGAFIPAVEFKYDEFRIAVEKASELMKGDLASQDLKLQYYLDEKWRATFHLLTPLFLANFFLFDDTGSNLSEADREKLRKACGLDTPIRRKNACFEYLKQLYIEAPENAIGRQSEMSTQDRMKLTALYNRYKIVIDKVLADRQRLKKEIPVMELKKKLLDKYKIPEKLKGQMFSRQTSHMIALDWAKSELKSNLSTKTLNGILNTINKQWMAKNRLLIDVGVPEPHLYWIRVDNQLAKDLLTYEPVYKIIHEILDKGEKFSDYGFRIDSAK